MNEYLHILLKGWIKNKGINEPYIIIPKNKWVDDSMNK